MVKVATFFLIGLAILVMLGRIRIPKPWETGKRRKRVEAVRCPECGTFLFGKDQCPCQSKKS